MAALSSDHSAVSQEAPQSLSPKRKTFSYPQFWIQVFEIELNNGFISSVLKKWFYHLSRHPTKL
jgi:hypothetical protein